MALCQSCLAVLSSSLKEIRHARLALRKNAGASFNSNARTCVHISNASVIVAKATVHRVCKNDEVEKASNSFIDALEGTFPQGT